jgi:hypothetical protein
MRTAFVIVFAMCLTGCATIPIAGGATSAAICDSLGAALPTRSRSDTPQTADEIAVLYATFAAACPAQAGLIPR